MVNEKFIKTLDSKNYKKDLILTYQTHLEIINNDEIVINGRLEDAITVRSIIDLELNRLLNKNEQKSQCNKKSDKKQTDDEIIWICDPYEVFDSESSTKKVTKKFTIENSFENLQFSSKSSKPSNDSVLSLTNLALSKGFDQLDIDRALKETNVMNIGEMEFLEYLKMTCNFNKKQKQNVKKADSPKQEPAIKKANLTKSRSPECEIVDFIPNKTYTIIKPAEKINTNQMLNEYAEMFQTQEFDKENEKMNKVKRISKLISAMPDDQKVTAIHQVSKYNMQNSKQKNGQASSSSNQIDPLIIEPEKSQLSYNPAMYQDDTLDHSDANFQYIFSNYDKLRDNLKHGNSNGSETDRRQRQTRNRRNHNHKSVDRNFQNFNTKNRSKSNNPKLGNNRNEATNFTAINHEQFDEFSSVTASSTSNLKYIIIDGSNVAREYLL